MKAFLGKFFKISGSLILLLSISYVVISIITSLTSDIRVHSNPLGSNILFNFIIIAGLIFIGIGNVLSKFKSPDK
jgi:hypothetical protein